MAFTDDAQSLEAGTYLSRSDYKEEASQLPSAEVISYDKKTSSTTARSNGKDPARTARMAAIRPIFFAMALLALAVVSIGSALPANAQRDAAKFGEMLAEVSDESLNLVLKKYIPQRYQPGVWRRGSTAMQAVHDEDAAAATVLVELAKRQNITITDTWTVPTTSTTTTIPPTSTDPDPTPSTSDPGPIDDRTDTSTPTPGPTATSPTASTTLTTTSTSGTSTSFETSSSTSSRRPRTSTSSSTKQSSSSITQQTVFTTLHHDGTRSTITTNVIVPASPLPEEPAGPRVTPDLQDAAIRQRAGMLGYALAGLAGVAAVI